MFFLWWDNLMDISGFGRTAILRFYAADHVGHAAMVRWVHG